MDFKVGDLVRMKSSISGINTYNIKQSIIRKHRKTAFKVRQYKVCENGDKILKFYGLKNNELRMAIWNADMFELFN